MKSPRAVENVRRAQAANNRANLAFREHYAGHRTRLTGVLIDAAPTPGGRVALLGAGSALDVDLDALAARYDEVHLVDLDADALAQVRGAATPATRARLHTHGPVDLSGYLHQADAWRTRPPTLGALLEAVPATVTAITAGLPRDLDVVASCCLVTQLFWGLAETLGRDNPVLADVQQVAALVHWRTLAELVREGGRTLLVTDVVSSETYPLDELEPDVDLVALRDELVRVGNVLRGGDPLLHGRLLRGDQTLRSRLGRARVLDPWLWHAATERVYLVTGWLADVTKC